MIRWLWQKLLWRYYPLSQRTLRDLYPGGPGYRIVPIEKGSNYYKLIGRPLPLPANDDDCEADHSYSYDVNE